MDPALAQQILNKYNLTTLYPEKWPDEKNDDSDSDAESPPTARLPQPVRRSRSRYSVLEGNTRFSRQVPGAERSKDGKDNLVQKDEQDPLGMYPSVVQVLRTRSVPVEEDIKLRRCINHMPIGSVELCLTNYRKPFPFELHDFLAFPLPLTSP